MDWSHVCSDAYALLVSCGKERSEYKYAMVLILLVDNDVYCLAILAQSPELGLPFPTCRGHLQAIKQQRAVLKMCVGFHTLLDRPLPHDGNLALAHLNLRKFLSYNRSPCVFLYL